MENYVDLVSEELGYYQAFRALNSKDAYSEQREDTRAAIKEWVEEFPKELRDECRKTYLREEINRTRELFFGLCKRYAARTDDFNHWCETYIDSLNKKLYKLNFEAKAVVGKKIGITPEKIAQARQHPITSLIRAVHGMAHCPFHTDRHASLDVRKNFYYCYSCNRAGDVIDLAMELESLTFEQAINRLT